MSDDHDSGRAAIPDYAALAAQAGLAAPQAAARMLPADVTLGSAADELGATVVDLPVPLPAGGATVHFRAVLFVATSSAATLTLFTVEAPDVTELVYNVERPNPSGSVVGKGNLAVVTIEGFARSDAGATLRFGGMKDASAAKTATAKVRAGSIVEYRRVVA